MVDSHGSAMSELESLTAYVMQIEKIDRGRYPVGIKHGITRFDVSSKKHDPCLLEI